MRVTSTGGDGAVAVGLPGRIDALKTATLVFAAGALAHNLDHLRRGLDVITPQLLAGGALVGIASGVAIGLVLVMHRDAARTAVLVGFGSAVAIGSSHLPPEWGSLSDPLSGSGMDAWTWVAILSAVGGGLLFGAVGLHRLRQRARQEP